MNEEEKIQGNVEDLEALAEEYKKVKLEQENKSWDLSDMAAKAAGQYGGLKEFAELTGEPYNTLQMYAHVSNAYEFSTRVLNLSFSHYKEVKDKEERYALLEKAEKNNWSVRRLHDEAFQNIEKPKKEEAIKQETVVEQPDPSPQPVVKPHRNKTPRTIDEVLIFFNWLTEADPDLAGRIGLGKSPCNATAAEHFSLMLEREVTEIGVLDLVNCIFLESDDLAYNRGEFSQPGFFELVGKPVKVGD